MKLRAAGGRSTGIALVVAAVVGGLLAVPAGSRPGGSPYSSITGAGSVTFADFPDPGVNTTEQFVISGHDGPGGPTGLIVVRSPLYSIEPATADVTCVVVDGNEARVGGKFREPFTFLGFPISHIGIIIRDNGSPGQGNADEIHPVEFIDRTRPPGFSPCNIQQPTLFLLDDGNFVVSQGDG